jgi:hypothetical protein
MRETPSTRVGEWLFYACLTFLVGCIMWGPMLLSPRVLTPEQLESQIEKKCRHWVPRENCVAWHKDRNYRARLATDPAFREDERRATRAMMTSALCAHVGYDSQACARAIETLGVAR